MSLLVKHAAEPQMKATSITVMVSMLLVCGRVADAGEFTITQMQTSGHLAISSVTGAVMYAIEHAGSVTGNWIAARALRAPTITCTAETDSVSSFFRAAAWTAGTPGEPAGMVLIPGGAIAMGDNWGDEDEDGRPVHITYVSPFFMDVHEVSRDLWSAVYQWAITNGYGFDLAGSGKAESHPIHSINWFDAVKWCNARSQREGRSLAYFNDAALSQPYRTNQVAPIVDWQATGYRLPTEAEWEKAARGGATGHRFPWITPETVSHGRANYLAAWDISYCESYPAGYHPTHALGVEPYTSAGGSFAPNDYGLYDVAGNVWEWCWDWYASNYYASAEAVDPRGPFTGSTRTRRGGCWECSADRLLVYYRSSRAPDHANDVTGFRTVISVVAP